MTDSWHTFLRTHGAIIEHDHIAHYGNPATELAAAASAIVMVDLSHFSLLEFSGEDAQAFLQGQLSCDMRKIISRESACYGSYCTPKGRMLASFLIWKDKDRYVMQLPSALHTTIYKRLSMFVLRSKVTLSNNSKGAICIGLAGRDSTMLIQQVGGTVPDNHQGMTCNDHCQVIRLGQDRFMLIIASGKAPAIWQQLHEHATPAGAACWDWLTICAGIPVITPATQEQFVPQMTNLEIIGGVSFDKGCYPGQEIIARTHYLGKTKRRMYLATIPSVTPVLAGDELFSDDMPEQSSGMIVSASPAPGEGYDVLVVLQTSSVETAARICWKNPQGPALTILPLPYTVT